MRFLTNRRGGKLVNATTDEMAQRMTTERVTAEQNNIHGQHQRADADAERSRACGISEPYSFPSIVRQKDQEQQRDVKKEAVNVLHDERERMLAAIALPRFTDGARGRVAPERFVISSAVVVASRPESPRSPQYQ